MKKIIISLLVISIVFASLLMGCGNNDFSSQQNGALTENNSEVIGGTVGTDLYVAFTKEIAESTDVEAIAKALCENEVFGEIVTDAILVEEGYLNGFDDEISGFSKGAMFAPMIGTIPFVGYVFETENPDELMKILEEHAQLNWNICTVADEMVVKSVDNYVFFVMAPNSFEE